MKPLRSDTSYGTRNPKISHQVLKFNNKKRLILIERGKFIQPHFKSSPSNQLLLFLLWLVQPQLTILRKPRRLSLSLFLPLPLSQPRSSSRQRQRRKNAAGPKKEDAVNEMRKSWICRFVHLKGEGERGMQGVGSQKSFMNHACNEYILIFLVRSSIHSFIRSFVHSFFLSIIKTPSL